MAEYQAYKGDGVYGLGTFLSGLAQAYKQVDRQVDFSEDHLNPDQRVQVAEWVAESLSRFKSIDFTKASAKADARSTYDDIFREHREANLPTIYNRQCRSNVYGDTTSQLLANDAYARTVDKAGRVTLDNIKAYADIEVNRSNPVNQGFNVLLQDHRSTREKSKEETSPQLGDFLTDAAIMAAVMSLLELFVNRE